MNIPAFPGIEPDQLEQEHNEWFAAAATEWGNQLALATGFRYVGAEIVWRARHHVIVMLKVVAPAPPNPHGDLPITHTFFNPAKDMCEAEALDSTARMMILCRNEVFKQHNLSPEALNGPLQ